MSSVNKVIIVGRLGQDPELNYLPSGNAVANLSVATSEQWKDKQSGEKQERTEWHRVSMFGRLGEIASQYLAKGSLVYIEGRLQTDKYEKDGATRYATKIIANQMQMLGSKGEQSRDGGQTHQQPEPSAPPADDFDDEIPFN